MKMKKLLAAGIMLAFTSLNAQMLSFGLRGGMQVHSKHTDCKFTDIGLIGSLKLPLLDFGVQGSVDYQWRKNEHILGCDIDTKVFVLDLTFVSIMQVPMSPVSFYVGIGGGMQSWTSEPRGIECTLETSTDQYADIHGLIGTKIKPPLSPVGVMAELKYSKVFAEDSNPDYIGITGGFFVGF